MTPSDSNLPDSNSPDAHGSDVRTSGVAAVSPWRSYSVWAAVLTFVVTRIYLYGFMIAGVSDGYVFLTAAGRALPEPQRSTLDAAVRRVLTEKHGPDVAAIFDARAKLPGVVPA